MTILPQATVGTPVQSGEVSLPAARQTIVHGQVRGPIVTSVSLRNMLGFCLVSVKGEVGGFPRNFPALPRRFR